MYYIYSHINKTNGKRYIGITNDIENRWRNNGIAYKPYGGKVTERPFWNAICKYGFDGFEHEIIKTVDSFEQACEGEKEYIAFFDTRNRRKGYNLAIGGNGGRIYIEHPKGMKGKHHGEEKKKQQSELMKELQDSGKMAWKNGHPKGMLGKHHSVEHNTHISEVMTGRVFSKETKIKMGNASRGRKHTEETKAKLSAYNTGKHIGINNMQAKRAGYILNGNIEEFGCVEYLLKDLKISKCLFYKLVGTEEEYNPTGRAKNTYAHLKGLKIFYLQ